jgi:hypothetical protein
MSAVCLSQNQASFLLRLEDFDVTFIASIRDLDSISQFFAKRIAQWTGWGTPLKVIFRADPFDCFSTASC